MGQGCGGMLRMGIPDGNNPATLRPNLTAAPSAIPVMRALLTDLPESLVFDGDFTD